MFFEREHGLLDAIKTRDLARVQECITDLQLKKINLNDPIQGPLVTPLHWAILKCNEASQAITIEILIILREAGVNVNQGSTDQLKYTPLHTASRRGLPQIVEWLIANGADPSVADAREKTPGDYIESAIQAKMELGEEVGRLLQIQSQLNNALIAPTKGHFLDFCTFM